MQPGPEFAYLTTTGRRRGRTHTVELWYHLEGDTAWVVHDGGPADWIANALAGPVTFRLGDRVVGATVEQAEPGPAVRSAMAARYQGWVEGQPLSSWATAGTGIAVRLGPPAEPTVRVTTDDVDGISGRLWLAGAYAVAEEPAPDGVTLVAGFADRGAAEAAAAEVGGSVVDVLPGVWLDAWRDYARTERAGRLVVHPAWTEPPATTPGEIVLEIDPGRVFGHGGHPTTRLLLAELDRRITGGERVLDVGSGSGVLAVAAARLGAAEVLGIDIDPDAVPVTLANAERNGVSVRATTTPLAEVDATFDVVLANIGADVLLELAAELQARVAPGGVLLLAGLLDERADQVAGRYAGTATRTSLDGWTALAVTGAAGASQSGSSSP